MEMEGREDKRARKKAALCTKYISIDKGQKDKKSERMKIGPNVVNKVGKRRRRLPGNAVTRKGRPEGLRSTQRK